MLLTGSLAAALLAASTTAPATAWGQGGCDLLLGTAASQAAPLVAPTLFVDTGFVNAGETPVGQPDRPEGGPTYRVLAGARYSLGRLFQGLALRSRAAVACRRERARVGLEAALAVGDVLGAERALEARAAVLEAALAPGEQMIAGLGDAVQEVRATIDALDADRLRMEELRQLRSETSVALARASSSPHPALAEVPTMLAQYQALDHDLGLAEERVRGAGSWDLAVRGGYDHLSDGRERVPFFAMLSASFDVGRLFSGSGDARALSGRARSESESPDALAVRVTRLLEAQRATLAAERARLRSSQALLASLDGQMTELNRLETSKIERFRHTLWFELVRLRAEHAYLAAHVEDLAGALGEKR
jgi:uncharacterized coiled-coil protein SlyX